jgi:outer membrane protein assembly factor BamD
MSRLPRLLLLLLVATLLAACASNKNKGPMSEKEYYDAAQKSMKSGNFSTATQNLEALESHYPVGAYTEQAQLELIYAKFRHVDYPGANAAADRFIRLHPNHPQVDYAYYMRGLSDYESDRDFFTRYLPVESAWRDLSSERDAFNEFRELITRYPNSEYSPDARARMVFIRNQMAEEEMHVARFYARKKAYVSCVNRARWIVENYPGAPQVPDALALEVWAYRKLDMKDLATQELALLRASYPGYNKLSSLDAALAGNENRSLLNIVTFGLFGSDGTDSPR